MACINLELPLSAWFSFSRSPWSPLVNKHIFSVGNNLDFFLPSSVLISTLYSWLFAWTDVIVPLVMFGLFVWTRSSLLFTFTRTSSPKINCLHLPIIFQCKGDGFVVISDNIICFKVICCRAGLTFACSCEPNSKMTCITVSCVCFKSIVFYDVQDIPWMKAPVKISYIQNID